MVRNTLVEDVLAVEGPSGVTFSLSFVPLVLGLVVAFFAEVFRQGAQLRADVDGLV